MAQAVRATAEVQELAQQALEALRKGDPQAARVRLERAIQLDERNPALWLTLASAFRQLGLPDDERQALERALVIEPRHLLALLQKGSLLDIQGRTREAAVAYRNALNTIPPGAQLAPNLQPAVRRAQAVIAENDAALEDFITERLKEARSRHADARTERFDRCIDAMLGKNFIYIPRPTFMHFPFLPAYEFYPREEFPWLAEIEAATPAIRAEFERVFAEDQARLEPYITYPEGVPLDQWAELNHSRKWSVFYLWREGKAIDEHIARCPQTAALLEKAPRSDVPGHAPTAFFSILDARAKIPPHSGVTNTRLIVHVPLIVPEGCGFRVGGERREWKPGHAFVFDDTIEHEAWNNSDVPRAVLIFDIWNPYLTEAERVFVRAATHAIGEYNRGEAPGMGSI
jgi:aspartate beta-hydroxylase